MNHRHCGPIFMQKKGFSKKFQLYSSLFRVSGELPLTVPFRKISTPGIRRKYGIFCSFVFHELQVPSTILRLDDCILDLSHLKEPSEWLLEKS